LAALQKQREALEKEEQALKAKSHDKILSKIVQMAKDAGLTASEFLRRWTLARVVRLPRLCVQLKRTVWQVKKSLLIP
jgi:prenyltransferase beta subunit